MEAANISEEAEIIKETLKEKVSEGTGFLWVVAGIALMVFIISGLSRRRRKAMKRKEKELAEDTIKEESIRQ